MTHSRLESKILGFDPGHKFKRGFGFSSNMPSFFAHCGFNLDSRMIRSVGSFYKKLKIDPGHMINSNTDLTGHSVGFSLTVDLKWSIGLQNPEDLIPAIL